MVELRWDSGRVELSNGACYKVVHEWPLPAGMGKLPYGFQVLDGDEVVVEAVRTDRGLWRRFWGPNVLEVTHRGEALCSMTQRPFGLRVWLDYERQLIPLPTSGGDVPGLPISLEFGGEPTRCEVDDERVVMLAVVIECVRNWDDFLSGTGA